MQVLILIEPTEAGRFRATAGDPFGMCAEADNPDDAARRLEGLVRERLSRGSRLLSLDLGNGSGAPIPLLPLANSPETEWFFKTMAEAIAENRRLEDEARE